MNQKNRIDVGFYAIIMLMIVIVTWLLLTPFVPAVASTTMHRFHLRSGSFTTWAIQFPIPTMYNFANRYQVRDIPAGLLDPIIDETETRYINHFPARTVTFFNTRFRFLEDGTDRWFTINTSYRGQALTTKIHAKPKEGGLGFEMIRLDDGVVDE